MKKNIIKNIEARVKPIAVIFLLLLAVFSGMFLLSEPVKADIGTVYYRALHDNGIFATNNVNLFAGAYYENVSGKYMFTFGGYQSASVKTGVYRTDINTNTSIAINSLPANRRNMGLVMDTDNDIIYIFGGLETTSYTSVRNTIYKYDIESNSMSTVSATLPTSSSNWHYGVWANNQCYIFGGVDSGENKMGKVFVYTPGNDTCWSAGLISGAFDNSVSHTIPIYKGSGDNIVLFGGNEGAGVMNDNIVIYNMVNQTAWKTGEFSLRDAVGISSGVYNPILDEYIVCAGYGAGNSENKQITSFDSTTFTESWLNNATRGGAIISGWSASNYSIFVGIGYYSGGYHRGIYELDLGEIPTEPATNVSLILPNNKFTVQGELGNTSWANETGSIYETAEFNISYNGTQDVDWIRVNCSDIHANITASNISVQFSSDNSTWGSNVLTLSDGSNAIWVNDTEWDAENYFYGANPFPIATNTSVYMRVRVHIPTGIGTETYSKLDYPWTAGYYT